MPFPWIPIITGLAGAFGISQTNKANRRMAQQQMDFQERMSSTAARRSAADFAAAGLNPALAYGNTASTPGGSTANMGDAISGGISSAQRARELAQQLRQSAEQHTENIKLTKAQREAAASAATASASQADLNWSNASLAKQSHGFNEILQPSTQRLNAANALLTELAIPGAMNEAKLNEKLGVLRPTLGMLLNSGKSLTSILSGMRR